MYVFLSCCNGTYPRPRFYGPLRKVIFFCCYPFCEYPFNIILNFSLGGELNGMMTWPGEIHDEDLPGEMWVDWVRVVLLDNNKINE